MLHELLKIVTYLSILTSSTTSSSHLSRESYSNNQRASPQYSFPTDDVYAPNLYDNNNNNGEDIGWIGYENSMDTTYNSRKSSPSSSSDYLITSYMNAGSPSTNNHPSLNNLNRFYISNGGTASSSSSNNNRNGGLNVKSSSKRGKKDNSRFNALKMSRSQQRDDPQQQQQYVQRKKSNSKISNKNATENMQNSEDSYNKKINKPSSSLSSSLPSSSYSNEYPKSAAISSSKEQELQQLFGVANAQIYRKHQKQQPLLSSPSDDDLSYNNKNNKVATPSDDAIDIKEPQQKRSNGEHDEIIPDMSTSSMKSHLMSRTTRRQREYDVPLIRKFEWFDDILFDMMHDMMMTMMMAIWISNQLLLVVISVFYMKIFIHFRHSSIWRRRRQRLEKQSSSPKWNDILELHSFELGETWSTKWKDRRKIFSIKYIWSRVREEMERKRGEKKKYFPFLLSGRFGANLYLSHAMRWFLVLFSAKLLNIEFTITFLPNIHHHHYPLSHSCSWYSLCDSLAHPRYFHSPLMPFFLSYFLSSFAEFDNENRIFSGAEWRVKWRTRMRMGKKFYVIRFSLICDIVRRSSSSSSILSTIRIVYLLFAYFI